MRINYVYASSILPCNSATEMQNLYGYNEEEYKELLYQNFIFYSHQHQQIRWKDFLKNTNKDEYYFFILIPNMLTKMHEILEKGGYKDLIWKSCEPATNSNYQNEGPRLTAYLFKGFENVCKHYGVNNV